MKTITLLFALGLVFAKLQAATILSQPPVVDTTGYPSARFTVNGHNSDEFVWDSFSTPTTKTLREIQWRGTRSGTTPVDFEISINTVALPGGATWHLNSNADETPTGTPGVYDYRFTLPAGFVLTDGQTYWLQIIAVQNEWPTWQWSTGTGGNGSHFAQVPAITGDYRYINTAGDVAFTLLNAATIPVTITVNALPDAGGTVTGGGTYQPGSNVTVQATPAADRTFLNWTEAGVIVSASADYTFVADGVSFVGWTENGELVDLPHLGGGLFQIIATADRNLIANFSYPNYTYYINRTVSPANSGSIVTTAPGFSSGSYPGGTFITLTAAPAPGYRFTYWRQGAGIGDLSGAPHFVSSNSVLRHMVCYGTTLTAVFEPSNPVLTVAPFPVAGGTVTGAGTFVNGTTVTVNAVPAVGYAFESWKIFPNVVSFEANYTFPITTHSALTAIFVATTNTVTADAVPVEGGSVSGAGVFGHGASVTLTAIPAPGFVFTNWSLGGVPAGTNNPVTFDALAGYVFVANFVGVSQPDAPPQLTVSLTATNMLLLAWPTNASGFVLQGNSDLTTTNWLEVIGPVTVAGANHEVRLTPPPGGAFFRLIHR